MMSCYQPLFAGQTIFKEDQVRASPGHRGANRLIIRFLGLMFTIVSDEVSESFALVILKIEMH